MAFFDTLKIMWLNRRHFKMQFFGLAVFAVVAIFVINLITIQTSYNKKLDDMAKANVRYTTSIQMSLSGVKGSVNRIYVDSSKTQCFILLQFNSTSSIPLDANMYQMMIAGVTRDGVYQKKPEENITGEIYMFNTSGLAALYLKSDIPFENSMKQLTLRSYKTFTNKTSPYYVSIPSDRTYDQCHIYFNPGGNSAQSIAFLENHQQGTDFNLVDIQRQVYSVDSEAKYRKEASQFLKDIILVMNQIVEYEGRLRNTYNVQVPDLPKYINGDYIDVVNIYDTEGNIVNTRKKYVPATYMPGGTEFDWYSGSILDGYYKLVPNTSDMSLADYIHSLDVDKVSRRVEDIKIDEWFYQDGTSVKLESDKFTTAYEKEVTKTIKKYVELLNEYYDLKEKYQAETLPSFLMLEYNTSYIGQAYTVRRTDAALTY